AFTQHVYIPHYLSTGGEVVGALLSHRSLGSRTVIPLAPNFDGEDGRALVELAAHRVTVTCVESSIWAKGLAVRQIDDKSLVVAHCVPTFGASRVLTQTGVNLIAHIAR